VKRGGVLPVSAYIAAHVRRAKAGAYTNIVVAQRIVDVLFFMTRDKRNDQGTLAKEQN
jgi:hypothetical protein